MNKTKTTADQASENDVASFFYYVLYLAFSFKHKRLNDKIYND